jgi:hypothetical protein
MKAVLYETSVGGLDALLATDSFVQADLYTFTLANNGPVLRYTLADTDISYSGATWVHDGPLIGTGSKGHWKRGLDVDTWQCSIMPRATDPITGAAYPDSIGSASWLAAARAGALNGALVTIDRAYFPTWPAFPRPIAIQPTGVLRWFGGRPASIDVGRTQCQITLNSHLELLDTQMPRRLFQPGCINTLFDVGCTLNAAAYATSGTINAASNSAVIVATIGTPSWTGTFALGRIKMTSGANAGFSRSIRLASSPNFTLLSPFPFPLASGDTFSAWPGCDKTLATCTVFGNAANFGGTPYVPIPETAV